MIIKGISQKQQQILNIFLQKEGMRSSDVREALLTQGKQTSLVTVKRALSEMTGQGLLGVTGSGPATRYRATTMGRLFTDVNAKEYVAIEPDRRYGKSTFDFALLPGMPGGLFSEQELGTLQEATQYYESRIADLPVAIQKKELERLVIELSWKSSKIEGNTYTLLDTEKLILENIEAPGRSKQEAQMILNHKEAFTFIRSNAKQYTTLTRTNLEQLHAILVKDLSINAGLRSRPVGVLGSKYHPLDNQHQIAEAISDLGKAVVRVKTPYAKAFLALAGVSYIQPFEDGNKRTARLMANALLLAHHLAPLSYRSVDEVDYREATLVFYELNSLVPLKSIYIDQYVFAAKNYGVK
jgi:fido (protein-threonine AMPylation protein)